MIVDQIKLTCKNCFHKWSILEGAKMLTNEEIQEHTNERAGNGCPMCHHHTVDIEVRMPHPN